MADETWESSRFAVRSIVVGAIVVLVGVILAWVASRQSSASIGAFVAGIGTTLITVGLLEILYESYLKRALIRDIREASRIESELYNIGLSNVSLERDVIRMRDFFESANSIDIVPLHPLSWLESESPWLTSLARQRQLRCRVYLPEPMRYSQFLSTDHGSEELSTAEHCSAKFRQYSTYWDPEDPNLNNLSLEIHYYSGYPQAGLVVSDNSAVLHIGSASRNSVDYISYAYKGEAARPTIKRLRHMITRLNATPISGTSEDNRQAEDILPTNNKPPGAQVLANAESPTSKSPITSAVLPGVNDE